MKPKVLIVDDQPEVYKAIKMYLGSSYETIYQGNGWAAFEELSNGSLPDVILSDIRMPGFDGYELLVHIKHSERLNKIPVVMISNLEASKERARFMNAGATDYLEKPFSGIELKKRLALYLKSKQLSN